MKAHLAVVLVVTSGLFGCAAPRGAGSAPLGAHQLTTGRADAGKAAYAQHCAACHGATGVEGGVGPSLRDERQRLGTDAAISWIEDPDPPMPKLYPKAMSEQQVRDVAAYIETL